MTPETTPLAATDVDDEVKSNLLVASVDQVLNWARSSSLWPVMFGLACCAIEMIATATSRYDIARFGAGILRPSPSGTSTLPAFTLIAPVDVSGPGCPPRPESLLQGLMLLQDQIREADKASRRPRPEPTGDFSAYLPPDDPIRLELESLFPPFTKREDATARTAG